MNDSTEEKKVTPVEEAIAEELPENVAEEPQAEMTLDDLKVGYVVGLTKEGNFIFEPVGQDRELAGMIGVHHHAKRVIETAYNEKRGLGDKLIVEVGKILLQLSNKLDKLEATLSPDNKL